jgi:hypothetical protein
LTIVLKTAGCSRRQAALFRVCKHPPINPLAIKYNPIMSAASNQAAMKRFERSRDLFLKENKQAAEAVFDNNISKMEYIFKTDGIKQEVIDTLFFEVMSLKMMKLFLQYGGDIHKHGPPLHPTPYNLLNTVSILSKDETWSR